MSEQKKQKRSTDRAHRLRKEASNCMIGAVRTEEEAFAAQLIDEAVRLATRSRELMDSA